MTFVFTGINYFAVPALVGPWFGESIIWETIVLLVLRVVVCAWKDNDNRYKDEAKRLTILFIVALIVMGIIPLIMGSGLLRNEAYRAMIPNYEVKEWKADMAPVDAAHIRLMTQQQAVWSANIQLGQNGTSLGSNYEVGTLSIQKVGNRMMWVGPLEFHGFSSWSSYDTTPGFVMVDAEDPSFVPTVVTNHKFRYMPSAYFGDELQRYVYEHGYQFKGITDFTFEVDDQLKPYWVVTVYKPTIGFYGEQVTEVLLVNPTDGYIQHYIPDEVPEWVDRILPEDFAHDRLVNHGKYIHGWLASWWGEKDVVVPTQSDLKLVWTDNGRAQWFTGITSPSKKDNALIGFVLMDSRTGNVRKYNLSGANEAGVDAIVSRAEGVANYPSYEAAQPILYNIYGELTWVVPVISGSLFKLVALVHATNGTVVVAADKHEALAAYQKMLLHSGNGDVPSKYAKLTVLNGAIKRIGSEVTKGNTTFHVILEGSSHVFTGSVQKMKWLPVAREGDLVAIEYVETKETVVPMNSFESGIMQKNLWDEVTPTSANKNPD